MRHALFSFLVLILSLLGPSSACADVGLSTKVSPESGTLDDTFLFSIVVSGTQSSSAPLLTGGDDFTLSLIGPQTSVTIINGVARALITYNYQLIPKREGDLSTPSVEVDVDGRKLTAAPRTVTVRKGAVPSASAGTSKDPVFLRQTASKQSAYVGEQITNMVNLFTRVDLNDPSLEDLSYDGFWQESFGPDERTQKFIDGHTYSVVRIKKALFPLKAGALTLPSRVLQGKVRDTTRPRPLGGFDPFGDDLFDNVFGRAVLKPITVRSNELTVDVKPLPPMPPDLPPALTTVPIVGKTTLSVIYPPESIKVGESKSVVIEVTSEGNLNPLKSLPFTSNNSVKVYEEQPETKNDATGPALISHKRFHYTIVPLRGGLIGLPSIKLTYFDPATESYAVAQSDSIAFPVEGSPQFVPDVKAAAPTVAEQQPQAPQAAPVDEPRALYAEPGFLERLSASISLGLALLLLAFAILVVGAGWAFVAWHRRKDAREELSRRIKEASDLSELRSAIVSALSSVAGQDLTPLPSDAIVAKTFAVTKNSKLRSSLERFFDEYAFVRYAPGEPSRKPTPAMDALKAELIANLEPSATRLQQKR